MKNITKEVYYYAILDDHKTKFLVQALLSALRVLQGSSAYRVPRRYKINHLFKFNSLAKISI